MSTEDSNLTVDDLLEAIRHPLSQHTDLQVSAARAQGWEHDRLPPEAYVEFMQVLDGSKVQAEAFVLAGRISEASSVINEAWKACEEIWKTAFPPHGLCLEMDGGRHWFVVVTGSFRQYSRERYGNPSFSIVGG